jgi:hypothetical protein
VDNQDRYNLDVFTEIMYKGIRYRAHPNYRGDGAWYDWCIVEFEPSNIDTNRFKRDKEMNALPAYPPGCYPAKILAFVLQQDPVVYEYISDVYPKLVVLVKKRSLWPKYFTYL